jgi:DNA-binding XRE family transcriptional regulator
VDRRWWIVILDGARLQQARGRAGMSQRQLAAAAGIGRATIGALESQDLPRCHFRTRARVAAALGTHPKAITAPGDPMVSPPAAPGDKTLGPGGARSRVLPGRPDQVREARAFLRDVLGSCPVIDTALLVCSEWPPTRCSTAAPPGLAARSPSAPAFAQVPGRGSRYRTKVAGGQRRSRVPTRAGGAWSS